MSFINTAALVILGALLLRKVVLMERYFEVRVFLITAFLCGLLLYFALRCLSEPPCVVSCNGCFSVYACVEF